MSSVATASGINTGLPKYNAATQRLNIANFPRGVPAPDVCIFTVLPSITPAETPD